MLNWPAITDRVILSATVALILFNILAGLMGGGEATISARMQYYGVRYPVVPMMVGALAAHWFWGVFGIRQ